MVAVRFALALGDEGVAAGDEDFDPTGSVTRTPASALELAPGDPAGLGLAGQAWAVLQSDSTLGLSDELVAVARDAAVAHLQLAERVLSLQERGASVYADAEALGIDGQTLGSQKLMAALVANDPAVAAVAEKPLADLIGVRLDWVDATADFIEELRSARVAFGIADW